MVLSFWENIKMSSSEESSLEEFDALAKNTKNSTPEETCQCHALLIRAESDSRRKKW